MQNITQLEQATDTIDSETPLAGRIDYYKVTMAQWAGENYPDAQVTFGFTNRSDVPLASYVNAAELQNDLNTVRQQFFGAAVIDMLKKQEIRKGVQVFTNKYLRSLGHLALPEITVQETTDKQLDIKTRGTWADATYWETAVLSAVNERYYRTKIANENLDLNELQNEGDRRLTNKINKINDYNATLAPETQPIQIVDFGTRRHFSFTWHRHVLGRLVNELPASVLLGTSNVQLAAEFNIKPMGTFAHEMPMVCAALNDETDESLRASHSKFLQKWIDRYPNLGSALTDTFGTEFFFKDFKQNLDPTQWQGFRHDSGDPIEFGEKALKVFEAMDVDPTDKTIVFSDGLDVDKIIELHKHFAGRVKVVFGWGTNLTNDLGLDALSIVMKATEAEGKGTVKFSDNLAKALGALGLLKRYARVFDYRQAEHKFEKTTY